MSSEDPNESVRFKEERKSRHHREERDRDSEKKRSKEKKLDRKRSRDSSDDSSASSSESSASAEEKKRNKRKHEKDKRKKDKKDKKKHKKDKHKQKKDKKHKKDKKEKLKEAEQFLLSDDDYYNKSNEFRVWMKEYFNIFIEDLPTDEARAQFSHFVEKWNAGALPEKYYKGISLSELDPSLRTKYKWSFAKNLDPVELGTLRDAVDNDTNMKVFNVLKKAGPQKEVRKEKDLTPVGPSSARQHQRQNQPEDLDDEDRRLERLYKKKDTKNYMKTKEAVLDELLPKATGRDALQEKRKLRAENQKRKDDSPEMNEEDLMGGGDDFQTRLRREKKRKEKRAQQHEEEYQRRLNEYKQKEDEKLAPLRALAQMRFQGQQSFGGPPLT